VDIYREEGSQVEKAFVKWRGLGYVDCTWEAWDVVESEEVLIAQYRVKEEEVERLIAQKKQQTEEDKQNGISTKKSSELLGNEEIRSRGDALSGKLLTREGEREREREKLELVVSLVIES
jgi:hypothetical protein